MLKVINPTLTGKGMELDKGRKGKISTPVYFIFMFFYEIYDIFVPQNRILPDVIMVLVIFTYIWMLLKSSSSLILNWTLHLHVFAWEIFPNHRVWNVFIICTIFSKPRLLNLILLNLIVRWPTGAAIVRPPHTKYTQSIGVCWEKLPKTVKIMLLQFNYIFGYGNFFTVWSSQYFQNIYWRKKIVIDGNSHNKITKLRQVPCFCDVCLFSIQMKPFNHS